MEGSGAWKNSELRPCIGSGKKYEGKMKKYAGNMKGYVEGPGTRKNSEFSGSM